MAEDDEFFESDVYDNESSNDDDNDEFRNDDPTKHVEYYGVEIQTDSDKAFRIQNQRILLTYAGSGCKGYFLRNFSDCIKHDVNFIRLASEERDMFCNSKHMHVLVEFKKIFQTTKPSCFDVMALDRNEEYVMARPKIYKILNIKNFNLCKRALAREDNDNVDLSNKSEGLAESVWNHTSLSEALNSNCRKYSDAIGITQLYNNKPLEVVPIKGKLEGWQIVFHDLCYKVADGRHCVFLYDRKGSKGKSFFGDYMETHYPDKVKFINRLDSTNLPCLAFGWHNSGWRGDTIIVNLTRQYENKKTIYGPIEMLLDNKFTNFKYVPSDFRFPNKFHIIIMANFYPDMSRLSQDRWRVYDLENEKDQVPQYENVNDSIDSLGIKWVTEPIVPIEKNKTR
jgi:hypothetical protein